MFGKILLPVDIAEPEIAKMAIDVAVGMARAFDSDIRLIHVTSPIVVASPTAVIPQSVYDQLGVYEKAELERMAASIDRPKGTVDDRRAHRRRLSRTAGRGDGWPADLIIVGAHKRSMATYLLGSSAAAIVRHASCTVMVVRSGKKAALL